MSQIRPPGWAVAATLAIVIIIVYAPSIKAPFIFDDDEAIGTNASIRSLWPLIGTEDNPGPLNPIRDLPTSARPLVNLSFALNYHFGGLNVIGYHIVNVAIHFFSAMLLWAIVRRTLSLPYFTGHFDGVAGWLGLVVALLWSVHPLNTEAVVYTTQRTELMMGLFYFATLYCSLRYWTAAPFPVREGPGEGSASLRLYWPTLAVLACLCGMLSKEVMVSAPIVVLLFDRTFIAGSFVRSLRRSWLLYLGLAATWLPLMILGASSPRSFSSGFGLGVNPFEWWFTQCKVLLMYFKLAVWPWPLRCAYELPHVDSLIAVLIYVTPIVIMACIAIRLLLRNHPVGFALFFIGAILAPTSILPILTEMAAERRMYLPLAALIVLAVVGAYLFVRRQQMISAAAGESTADSKAPRVAGAVSVTILLIVYSIVSVQRIGVYYDETLMWRQVAESQPLNHIAHFKLGLLYNQAGREADSFAELQAAVTANPAYPNGRSAFGFALMNAGRMPEAIESIQAALDVEPNHVGALNNMGIALTKLGRNADAIEYLRRAVQVAPNHGPAHNNLGKALLQMGDAAAAIEELKIAHTLAPDDLEFVDDLARALASNNRLPEAIELVEQSIRSHPDVAAEQNNLAILLYQAGEFRGAAEHLRGFLQLSPDNPSVYCNLANVVAAQGNFAEAFDLCDQAIKLARSKGDEATANQAEGLKESFRAKAGSAGAAAPASR